MVAVTLPDGSKREFDAPVRVLDVAQSIGSGLAKAALAGMVDGRMVDTSFLIERDSQLAIITDKSPEALDIVRHSTAHLLAYAVKELFPEAQVTIGPVIENGFYYDFSFHRPFTPDDLTALEKRMAELAKKDEPVTRTVMPRDAAVQFLKTKASITKPRSLPAFRKARMCRSTPKENLRTYAAAPMCHQPASSRSLS